METRPFILDNRSYKTVVALQCRCGELPVLAVVNYSDFPVRCVLAVSSEGLAGSSIVFNDIVNHVRLVVSRQEISNNGLNLELPPYAFMLFELGEA